MAKKKAVRRRAPARRAPEPPRFEIDEDMLRDMFAACALMGISQRIGIPDFSMDGYDSVAEASYNYADAMLDAREGEEEAEDEDEDR